MATITTRSGKGSALTFTEMDANFTNLNTDKLELSGGTLTGNLVMAAGKTVTIGNDYTFPVADGTVGQVLQTDGNGNLSFATGAGGGIALTDLSVGAEGTASGDGSLAYNNTTGVFTYTPPVLSGLSGDTDSISEGTTNLYYTDARFDTRLATKSTTNLSEGTNLYYTDERVDDRVNGLLVAGTNITLTYNDVANTLTIDATDTGILNVVEDTTPQLGGDLDVNGQSIVTTSNGDITLAPNGTGDVIINGNSSDTIIEMHNAGVSGSKAGLIIHPNNKGGYQSVSGSSNMLYHTGIQIEEQGDYTFPALVLKNNSINGYPYLWAAKAGPANRLTTPDYTTDDYMANNEIMFRYFGAPYNGAASAGQEYYTAGAICDMKAAENHSSGNLGCKIEFSTINTGSTSNTTKMTIGNQVTMNSLLELKAYASTALPTGVNGALISISDNNYKPAYYNGSTWKYIADDTDV